MAPEDLAASRSWWTLRQCGHLPAIGRFLTQDPIGHEGGLNLYAYCDNSPLTKVDPDGKQGKHIIPQGAPKGVNVRSNILVVRANLKRLQAERFSGDGLLGLLSQVFPAASTANYVKSKLAWFNSMVKDGGPWDYKLEGSNLGDAFGNWHYGVVGSEAGFSEEVLLRAAGLNQMGKKGWRPQMSKPWDVPWGSDRTDYGDYRRDQLWIRRGIAYWRATYGGKK